MDSILMIPMILAIAQHLNELGADGFLVNTSDAHSNEYIGPSDQILEASTGFTGSNGLALIGNTSGLLYTDSRYHLQAAKELDPAFWSLIKERADFFKAVSKDYRVVLYDPTFFSDSEVKDMEKKLSDTTLIPNAEFIDHVWINRPLRIFQPVIDLETLPLADYIDHKIKEAIQLPSDITEKHPNVTGTTRVDKLANLREEMRGTEVIILTALDEIAWILNLRGQDIPYNPVFYSYLIITLEGIVLYSGVPINVPGVPVKAYTEFLNDISQITSREVRVSQGCNALIYRTLTEAKNTVSVFSKVSEAKASKNATEILGFKIAHLYDAIALVKLFEVLESKIVGENHCITEGDVDTLLNDFKSSFTAFEGPSFATIAGYAENGAIIHHRGSTRRVCKDNLLLIDSGSQYILGTTDITRTICLGTPTPGQVGDFTAVLKGQIAAITQKFKMDYPSTYLDAIVRAPIWNTLEDFAHATGHGVGHFLNVHESPPHIGKSDEKISENMIFSIEPGIYKENQYGIRIEDLVLSKKINTDWLEFENITLTPLQLKMIDTSKLEKKEKQYLNEFNSRSRRILQDFISENELGYKFMMKNTESIQ